MTTSLVVASDPVGSLIKAGEQLFASGFLGLTSAAQGFVVAHTCEAMGITALDFARTYHVIKGRPAMRADAMLAEFRTKHGGRHRVVEHTSEAVSIEFTDRHGHTMTERLTWEAAREERWPWRNPDDHSEGLKDNWSTLLSRRDMMFARVVSGTLRHMCPEICAGVYTPEEILDLPDSVVETVQAATKKSPPSFAETVAVETQAECGVVDSADVVDVQAEFTAAAPPAPPKQENEPAGGDRLRGPGGFADLRECTEMLQIANEMGIADRLQDAFRERGVADASALLYDDAHEMLLKLRDAKKQWEDGR